jgi:hypothetical protein
MTAKQSTTTRIISAEDQLTTCVKHGYLPPCSLCELETVLQRIFTHPTLTERICRVLDGVL